MKVKSSLKSLAKRARQAGGFMARRRGKLFVICKRNRSLNARQG